MGEPGNTQNGGTVLPIAGQLINRPNYSHDTCIAPRHGGSTAVFILTTPGVKSQVAEQNVTFIHIPILQQQNLYHEIKANKMSVLSYDEHILPQS